MQNEMCRSEFCILKKNFTISSRINICKKVGQPSFEIYQYTMSNMKDKVIDS